MKTIYLLLLFLYVNLGIAAEPMIQNASLHGHVTDAVDGSSLTGVAISVPETGEGTTTDIQGNYSLSSLPKKKITLQVSYLGHQTIIREVDLTTTAEMNFVMQESNAMINEVVVTGLTGQALMKDSPTPISIITSSQLQTTQSTNIIDAISHQPGISQITTGSGISKPVIRGLGYNRIVTVNDGVRQEGQQWGDEHGIEIDPQSVNQVEVLKGPASLMYGSDAMAGVIIFHGEPTLARGEMKANATSEYQTNNGLFDYSLDFAGNKSGTVWNLRYSDKMAHAYKNKYDGYVLNSQFREQAISSMFGFNRSWGYSHLILSFYHLTPGIIEGERDDETGKFVKPAVVDGKDAEVVASDHDLNTYGRGMPYQQIHHYKAVLDNSFYVGLGNLKLIIAYQQNRRQEFENVQQPSMSGLDFMLHTVNYDLHYSLPEEGGWKHVVGINGMYQRSLNKGDEYLIPAYNLFDVGAFVTSSVKLDKWNLSGGLRIDNRHLHSFALEDRFQTISRNFTGVTGSIGAVYEFNPNTHLRLNAARGFRTPNMSELASNGEHEGTLRYEVGNAGLSPEYSWQIDAGMDYSSSCISAQVSMFANFIDNYIFGHRLEDIITDGLPTYKFTQGDARLTGFEASIDVHPVGRLHFQNAFSYVNAIQLHQSAESKYLPMTPPARFTSDLRYDFIRDGKRLNNLYVKCGLECCLRQNHCYVADNTETATPSYTLLSMDIGTDILYHGHKMATLIVNADNITDRAYQNHLSRLKYADINNVTGRVGVYNMGRNISFKVVIPII